MMNAIINTARKLGKFECNQIIVKQYHPNFSYPITVAFKPNAKGRIDVARIVNFATYKTTVELLIGGKVYLYC